MQAYFKTAIGRLAVSVNVIEENLNELRREVSHVPIQFVFRVDEMGAQDFCDKREKTLIVPISYKGTSAPFAVYRDGKRTLTIACISLAGFCRNVLFAVSCATVDNELYNAVYTMVPFLR